MEELLVYLACLYQGDYQRIKQAIARKEVYDKLVIENRLKQLKSAYTTILSPDYPVALRALKDPPYVLFYYGHLELTQKVAVAMVGMRQPSDYGKRMARQFATEIGQHFVIVSGMAKGIDGICHAYAKETIAVLGCGIDRCYPACHQSLYERLKENGLVISEYPEKTPPKRYYFPWRNRLVAGLGQLLIVVEAKEKSGTMITVGHALEQGKPIFAIPARLTDYSGTLTLLRDGAFLLLHPSDIYEELNFAYLQQKD